MLDPGAEGLDIKQEIIDAPRSGATSSCTCTTNYEDLLGSGSFLKAGNILTGQFECNTIYKELRLENCM